MTSPGWYPDPHGAPVRRWWDGQQWTASTEHVEPMRVTVALPAIPRSRLVPGLLMAAGGLGLIAGAALPWVDVISPFGAVSVSGINHGALRGWLFVLLGLVFLALAAAVLLRRQFAPLVIAGLLGVVGTIGAGWQVWDLHRHTADIDGVSIGIGMWLVVASAGVAFAASVAGLLIDES